MSQSIHLSKLAYSIEDFCELVGIGRSGAFREIREGRLRAVKIGRRVLVPAAELKTWLERLAEISASKVRARR